MQRIWLGDALDFWKGALLQVLQVSAPAERTVRVLPMFTDPGWTTAEMDIYAQLLGVDAEALLSTSQLTKTTRSAYFAPHNGLMDDAFVDADTGIATGKPEVSHVTAAEVVEMLSGANVVAVYQHRPQRVSAPWLAPYANRLTAEGARVTGYEAAEVGMLFATRSPSRDADVRRALSAKLGPAAGARGAISGRVV